MKRKQVQRFLAEAIGTALLVATVLGSGFMATRLAASGAEALLLAALAAAAVLVVLIRLFQPISGAQLNPAVTLALALRKKLSWTDTAWYLLSQVVGAAAGAVLANLMFEAQVIGLSTNNRLSSAQWLSEGIATFGLVFLILVLLKFRKAEQLPIAVALWILAGHVFTASTSFANPAVTVGRALSEASNGIAWSSVPGFIAAQLIGVVVALLAYRVFFPKKAKK